MRARVAQGKPPTAQKNDEQVRPALNIISAIQLGYARREQRREWRDHSVSTSK